jgi:quinol monooxygenase YgiN
MAWRITCRAKPRRTLQQPTRRQSVQTEERTTAVTYLIKFDVVPDQSERFLALLNGVLDAMLSEPMFHQAFLHEDPEAANRFMLLETWESHEDVLEVQLKRSYREAWHQALPELLSKPRDVSIWEPLRADIHRA